jgi:PhnB protein
MDHMSDTIPNNSAGPAPAGVGTVLPFVAISDCAKAIALYQEIFGAELLTSYDLPDGTVTHADLRIGDSRIQVGEPIPSMGILPPPVDGNAFTLTLWITDPDAVFDRAVAAGATVMSPMADVFSGDRMGVIRCPYGVRWCLARHDRDVPEEEIAAIVREWAASQSG